MALIRCRYYLEKIFKLLGFAGECEDFFPLGLNSFETTALFYTYSYEFFNIHQNQLNLIRLAWLAGFQTTFIPELGSDHFFDPDIPVW